jgi:ERCC4-type nuclease
VILVDPRAGSGQRDYRFKSRGKWQTRHDEGLAKSLRSAPYHLKTQEETLSAGDISWLGNGPGGEIWPIGVEYKKLRDVLQCVTTGRFADIQLPELQDTYQVRYLLVQGRWKCGVNGELLRLTSYGWRPIDHGRSHWTYLALEHWLSTMRHCGDIVVVEKEDRDATLAWIKAEYTWWTAAEFEEHRAHVAPYIHKSPHGTRPSPAVRIFAQLPGIGWERASMVARVFGSVAEACKAGDREWQTVPGIGPTIARRAQAALNGKG